MADTVPAMLEPGEYVLRKDAVDKIGVENLDMMNNIDKSSQLYMSHGGFVPQMQNAHSAIDELLALNTLSNQRNSDMTRETSMMNKGGQLKPIPEGNKGLAKLPDTVRNRMGYMQEGGKVPKDPDPLQIDARMRGDFKDVGTIGIVDSLAYYKDLRDKAMRDKKMLEEGAFLEGYEPSMDRIEDDLMRALKFFEKQYKSSPKPKGYQTGGYTAPTLQSIYEMARLRPVEEQENLFQEFDTSLLGGTFSDFSRTAENLQQLGSENLERTLAQTRGMGGFGNFGFEEAIQDETRRQAERDYQFGLQSATERRDEGVQSVFDDYTSGILGQLSDLRIKGEGTEDITDAEIAATPVPSSDPNWNPPSNPVIGATYNFGNQVWERKNLRTTRGNMRERWVRIN